MPPAPLLPVAGRIALVVLEDGSVGVFTQTHDAPTLRAHFRRFVASLVENPGSIERLIVDCPEGAGPSRHEDHVDQEHPGL